MIMLLSVVLTVLDAYYLWFQSLNAMSAEPCRPFDIERQGLNLGEAAATVVLSNRLPSGTSASW